MNEPSTWIEIVADVAHELKTPIASASGFIDLVVNCGDPLTARQERFANMALASLEHMEALVLQLLDMARLMDDSSTETRPCDLCVIIDRAIVRMGDLATRQQVTIHTEFGEDVGRIESDERVLEQVLLNLLSNAIKYNHANGEVWVRATGLAESIEVSVRDNGRGISPDALPHVFERFYRESKDKRIEGTGLGLAIVKSLVEKHGGHIRVESTHGQGATFTFVLPRVHRQSEGRADVRESTSTPVATSISVERASRQETLRESSNEMLDSVDDSLQEPYERRGDPDESDLAQQE